MLSRLGDVESVVGDLRAGRTGSLSIAYFASVGSAWMPTVVSTMMAEFPAVRLDLALRDDVPTDPAERPDLQIVVEQGAIHRPGLVAQHLLDDPYVAVLPSGHPLAEREQIDLVDLAGDRWVDNDFARGWCRKQPDRSLSRGRFQSAVPRRGARLPDGNRLRGGRDRLDRAADAGGPQPAPGVVAVPVTSPTPVRSIYALVQPAVEDTAPARAALAVLRGCAAAATVHR